MVLLNQNFDQKYGPTVRQFLKFAVVGVINTAIDFTVLNILSSITGITKGNGLIPINVVAFTCAVTNSFFMNRYWSFGDKNGGEGGKKFSLFLLVTILGAVINTSIVRGVATNIPPMFDLSPKLWLNVAKAAATGVTMFWNFFGYKLVVFKK